MHYTREQVLQMAPDDASAKAGQQLASDSKWVTKYIQPGHALWGDCQGSGKTPYRTMVDLHNIAFKCSCPSRKFPCKHGLGLLLLYAQQPGLFIDESQLPAHVAEWLDKRKEKEAAKEVPNQEREKPVDEEARAKRAASREKKVNAGIAEVRSWIRDAVRTGLMHVPQHIYQFHQHITARMIDAQAGGLASQLRQIDRIPFHQDGWQKALIKRLSSIYLLTEAYQRIAELPAAMAREVQNLIGWTTPKEEVLQQQALTDTWVVLSVTSSEDGNIQTERIWLYGLNSGEFALLLHFYAGNQLPQHLLFPGLQLQAQMVFFPGANQRRALIKEQQLLAAAPIPVQGGSSISILYEHITAQLAQNPFAAEIPFLLQDIQLVYKDAQWYILDMQQRGNSITNPEDECWHMLAFSQGRAFHCFGIYENETFQLHLLWTGDKTYVVKP